MDQVADIFAERYELISQLGNGGMGSVYKARHRTLDQVVAIKVVRDNSSEASKRLLKEARALAALHHPHIVRVLSVDILPGDFFALVMEFVEGEDLEHVIATEGKLAPERCRAIMMQAADGLSEAHRQGIIHRDLKPTNILLSKSADGSDSVKILDFGIAKILSDDSSQRITSTGAIIGSPSYMSPEQCQAKPADARSDIYSLGCVIFEALTGRKPVEGESAYEVIMNHVEHRITTPETDDRALAGVVIKCTERNPDDRFQSAQELLHALGRHSFSAVPIVKRQAPTPSSRRLIISLIAGASVIAMIAIAAVTLSNQSTTNQNPLVSNAAPSFSYSDYNAARLASALLTCFRRRERPPVELIEAVNSKVSEKTDIDDLRAIGFAYQDLWKQRYEREYGVMSRRPLEIVRERLHQKGVMAKYEVYPLADSYLPQDYEKAKVVLEDEIRFCRAFNDDKQLQIPTLQMTILAAATICGEKQEADRLRAKIKEQYSPKTISALVQFPGRNPIILQARRMQPAFPDAVMDDKPERRRNL